MSQLTFLNGIFGLSEAVLLIEVSVDAYFIYDCTSLSSIDVYLES